MTDIKISIKNLFVRFDKKQVLRNLNLDVFESESLSIIGESGSGKSVLARCISGLMNFNSGYIGIKKFENIKDLNQRELNEHTSKFGILFQNAALLDSLNIEDNLRFADQKIDLVKILNEVSLPKKILGKFPSEISVGAQKRIGLARAILKNPEVLILDEPTTGLDPLLSNQINILIRDIVKKKKITAITITHDMSSVNEYGEKVAFLKNGKIEWYGNAKRIYNARNQSLKAFIHGVI